VIFYQYTVAATIAAWRASGGFCLSLKAAKWQSRCGWAYLLMIYYW